MASKETDLHPIEASVLHARRERVFLVLSGLFLGTLAMLNILGISRFIKLGELTSGDGSTLVFAIAVGVLPYPLTFLCTDFISEFYGRKRANFVVFVGLLLNIWVVFVMWLGGVLPGFESLDPATGEMVRDAAGRLPVFFEIRALTFGAVTASMIAYMAAQFCDVYVFHFWKRLTKGKHLWLRNNFSTFTSQFVDTATVLLLLCSFGVIEWKLFWPLMANGYLFKVLFALFDTPIIYAAVYFMRKYFGLEGHGVEIEESGHEGGAGRTQP